MNIGLGEVIICSVLVCSCSSRGVYAVSDGMSSMALISQDSLWPTWPLFAMHVHDLQCQSLHGHKQTCYQTNTSGHSHSCYVRTASDKAALAGPALLWHGERSRLLCEHPTCPPATKHPLDAEEGQRSRQVSADWFLSEADIPEGRQNWLSLLHLAALHSLVCSRLVDLSLLTWSKCHQTCCCRIQMQSAMDRIQSKADWLIH